VVSDRELLTVMRVIGEGESSAATEMIEKHPALATTRLATGGTRTTSEAFFLERCRVQLYQGHTALHVAAAVYDTAVARALIDAGADIRASNRRGAEPIHAAMHGGPGSSTWDPQAQVAMIRLLIQAGADPEALASDGVTPLLRAVRNRCSAAVRELLDAGVDPNRRNDNGSSAIDLARVTSGRGGTGAPAAKVEQARIIAMLEADRRPAP